LPRERLLGGSNQHSGGTLVGVPGGLLPVATSHLGLGLDDGDLVGEFADAVRARHGHEHVFEGVPVEVHVMYGSSVNQRTNGSPTSTAMSSPLIERDDGEAGVSDHVGEPGEAHEGPPLDTNGS